MFADVRGFTTLTEQLPVREAVTLLDRFYQLASDVIQQQTGDIFKFLGDGLLAAFSDPTEPRTEARRAYQAALTLIEGFERIKSCYPSTVCPALGIGLARGTVMLSRLGAAHAQDLTIIGDPVNTASRLAGSAEGKQALCSADVQKLLEPDEYQFIGDLPLKGKATPVVTYRLVRPQTAPDTPQKAAQNVG
jgi:class 3 adenylate cyclase